MSSRSRDVIAADEQRDGPTLSGASSKVAQRASRPAIHPPVAFSPLPSSFALRGLSSGKAPKLVIRVFSERSLSLSRTGIACLRHVCVCRMHVRCRPLRNSDSQITRESLLIQNKKNTVVLSHGASALSRAISKTTLLMKSSSIYNSPAPTIRFSFSAFVDIHSSFVRVFFSLADIT